ncbi:MAG: class I tRNA ligase family protein [Planctomycetota bacterium]|nr:class I tRNA ligase family protein [Planctomycetota bacterium]
MGPLEASKPWNPRDIAGLFRFLQRAWRCCVSEIDSSLRTRDTGDTDLERRLHRLIAKVGADVERLSFNTAIAAMIEFVNACVALDKDAPPLTREQISRLALVLSPFAPHIAEELWSRCGNAGFAMHAPWPAYDAALLHDAVVEVPVQVQGKVRSRVRVPAGADAAAHESIALADPRVRECIADKPVKKVIVVPGRMVNIVV